MTRTVLAAVALSLTIAGCASTTSSSATPPPASDTVVPSSSSASPGPPSVASATPSPTPTTFEEAYAVVQSGVVRLDETRCDGGSGSGSGFLVAPDLVATVAHVVAGAHSLSVRVGKAVTRGTVVAFDTDKDLALVRLSTALPGRVLRWGKVPAVGGEVAVVGYPLGEPLSMTIGHVNAVGARIEIGDATLTNLVKYDAATNPGNSGSPLIAVDGSAVGLVDADTHGAKGESYAIPVQEAQPSINLWQTSTDTVPLAPCTDPWDGLVSITSTHADAPAIAQVLANYFGGLNAGNYEFSMEQLTATARKKYRDADGLGRVVDGAVYDSITVDKAKLTSNTTDTVSISYNVHPRDGRCRLWHSRVVVRNDSGVWLIDSEKQLSGTPRRC